VGHEIYYRTIDRHIGSVSIRRWEEVSKLLPLLVDFLNRAMRKEWGSGTMRDVRLLASGATEPGGPGPDQQKPPVEALSLEQMLSEEEIKMNELIIHKATEWDRLFAWCDFLATRDGAYALYAPVVETLRPYLAGICKEFDDQM
jgi:hypothetical protein